MASKRKALAERVRAIKRKWIGSRTPYVLVTLAAAVLATVACKREEVQKERAGESSNTGGGPAPQVTSSERPDNSASKREEILRLKSLPYLGWAEEEAGPESGVVLLDRERSSPGYNLYVNCNTSQAVLINAVGRVIKTWQSNMKNAKYWYHVKLLSNGDLLALGREKGSHQPADEPQLECDHGPIYRGAHFVRFTWNGEIAAKKYIRAHHRFEPLPNGRILCLLHRCRDLPEYHPTATIIDDPIAILSKDFEIITEVSLYNLFRANPELLVLQRMRMGMDDEGHPYVDLFHANSVEWLTPEAHLVRTHEIYTGNKVLVCVRQQDTVIIIDWDKLEPVWAWGLGELSAPHCATMLSNGHIMVFDNGMGRGFSRVVEVDPRTNEIAWQYTKPNRTDFYSKRQGTNQRLANGNTLITNSEAGEAFEVAPNGDVVWQFLNPLVNSKNRRATITMERLDVEYVDTIIRLNRN